MLLTNFARVGLCPSAFKRDRTLRGQRQPLIQRQPSIRTHRSVQRLRLYAVAYEGGSNEPFEEESYDPDEEESYDEPPLLDDTEGDDEPFSPTGKQTGVVKWFDTKKGFGFIQADDGSGDLFVHHTNIISSGYRSLQDGEPVEFVMDDSEDGRMKAVQVTGPDGAEPRGTRLDDPFAEERPGSGGGRYASEAFTEMSPLTSGRQVVVHNVPWSVTGEKLMDAFEEFGAIDAEIMFDELGRSRGYGIVKFSDKADAERAIEEMHMMDFEGRSITVRFDRYG